MQLSILEIVWQDITIDFITHLPTIRDKYVIIVVVDNSLSFATWKPYQMTLHLKW